MVLSPPEENEREPFMTFQRQEVDTATANVEIKVGLAAQKDGVIKLRRGKTQIITVNFLANKEERMQKAKAKHASFDQLFDDMLQYSLLYPDF